MTAGGRWDDPGRQGRVGKHYAAATDMAPPPWHSSSFRYYEADMTLPNFYIIGAPKSATTALYHCLRQHPQIFMPKRKEPNFFALLGERLDFVEPNGKPAVLNKSRYVTMEAYSRLFEAASGEKAVGEASVMYLRHPRAAARIREHTPDAKLIALLRNPVDSAFSEFHMNRGFGIEPCDNLRDALEDQERRRQQNCVSGLYVDTYLHHRNLTNFTRSFPEGELRVFLNEDFRDRRDFVLKEIFDHLGVDRDFVPEIPDIINVSGVPRSMFLHRFLSARMNPVARRILRLLPTKARFFLVWIKSRNLQRQTMPPELRRALVDLFREDILRLQEYLNRDLSHWLE